MSGGRELASRGSADHAAASGEGRAASDLSAGARVSPPPSSSWLDAFWTGHEDATALALVRIAFVAVLAFEFLLHWPLLVDFYSDHAILGGEYARRAFPSRSSILFQFSSPTAVKALFSLGALAHLCWLVGLLTPLAAVLSLAAWSALMGRMPMFYAYPDEFAIVFGALLACTPSGRALSLDAHFFARTHTVPVWCRRILQLQVAVLYLATALEKSGPTWWRDGTAIYFSLVNPYNRHFDIAKIAAELQPWILAPATRLAYLWEKSFIGFALWHMVREVWLGRRGVGQPLAWVLRLDPRWWMLGFGAAMHVSIQVFLYVEHFTALMLACYTCFLMPHEVRTLLARVIRGRWGVTDAATGSLNSR